MHHDMEKIWEALRDPVHWASFLDYSKDATCGKYYCSNLWKPRCKQLKWESHCIPQHYITGCSQHVQLKSCREYRVEIGRGISRNIGESTRITYFDGKSSSLPKDSLLLRENQRFTFRSDKVISAAQKHNILLFSKKYNLYSALLKQF